MTNMSLKIPSVSGPLVRNLENLELARKRCLVLVLVILHLSLSFSPVATNWRCRARAAIPYASATSY